MDFKEYHKEEMILSDNFHFINNVIAFLNREIRVDQIGYNYIHDIRNRQDALDTLIDWNKRIDDINVRIKNQFPTLDRYKVIVKKLAERFTPIREINSEPNGELLNR